MTLHEARAQFDQHGMYDAIRSCPDQWAEGRARAQEADLDGLSMEGIRHVLVVGMGGSAIGGDVLRCLARPVGTVPVEVSRGYGVPAWAGPETLVVASSYSGGTEETLSAVETAHERGCRIACITTGGTLRKQAQTHGWPHLVMPGGLQPRAALGYSLTALLTLAERIGLYRPGADAWDEVHAHLTTLAQDLGDLDGNRAYELAHALQGTLPVIYAAEGLLEVAALRWQTQLHENAKTLAYGRLFPEMNHNEIMGWEHPDALHGRVSVVVLRDEDDPPQVARRMDVTRELVGERAAHWFTLDTEGSHPLTRVLSQIHLGDWVSYYLGLLRGVDPTPVALIGTLKQTLAAS